MTTLNNAQISIEKIGEEIGLELGKQFVENYNLSNPTNQSSYIIGKEILIQILSQPGCAGIQLLNAKNENGEDTLVYIGLDNLGKQILSYTSINNLGELYSAKGIVADRLTRPRTNGIDEDCTWEIE